MAVKRKYYLWLDSVSSQDMVMATVGPKGERLTKRRIRQGSRSERLLIGLASFVASQGATPRGIGVVAAGGSFSQSRRACVVANALGYAWGVPVCEAQSEAELVRCLVRAPRRSLIVPRYYGPAVG